MIENIITLAAVAIGVGLLMTLAYVRGRYDARRVMLTSGDRK